MGTTVGAAEGAEVGFEVGWGVGTAVVAPQLSFMLEATLSGLSWGTNVKGLTWTGIALAVSMKSA